MTHTPDTLVMPDKNKQQHMPFWGDSMTALIQKVGQLYQERHGSAYGLYRKNRATGEQSYNISFVTNIALRLLAKHASTIPPLTWKLYIDTYMNLRQENSKKKQLNITMSDEALGNIPAIGPVIEKNGEWKKAYLKRQGVYNAPMVITLSLLFTIDFYSNPENEDC